MRRRRFKNSDAMMVRLETNAAHQFALQQTLKIYGPNAAYTFIPKNACSTLRFSIAVANGMLDHDSDPGWIHSNNRTFVLNNEQAFLADFAFIVLRCPFRRLYSAYMDKIVGQETSLWELHRLSKYSFDPPELSFERFVKLVTSRPDMRRERHWRPQVDFLLYREYDAYYALEDFKHCVADLKDRIGFEIIDARKNIGHDIQRFEHVDDRDDYQRVAAADLMGLKRAGKVPVAAAMFTDTMVSEIARAYASDIELYREHFGGNGLLFDPA